MGMSTSPARSPRGPLAGQGSSSLSRASAKRRQSSIRSPAEPGRRVRCRSSSLARNDGHMPSELPSGHTAMACFSTSGTALDRSPKIILITVASEFSEAVPAVREGWRRAPRIADTFLGTHERPRIDPGVRITEILENCKESDQLRAEHRRREFGTRPPSPRSPEFRPPRERPPPTPAGSAGALQGLPGPRRKGPRTGVARGARSPRRVLPQVGGPPSHPMERGRQQAVNGLRCRRGRY
jgi:hypothetical protein